MERPPNGNYGVGLLDDLHAYFPDVLYNTGRFRTIGDLLGYVHEVAVETNEPHYLTSLAAYRAGLEHIGMGGESDVEESESETEAEEEEADEDGRVYIAISHHHRRRRSEEEEESGPTTPTQRPRLSDTLLQEYGRTAETTTTAAASATAAAVTQSRGLLRNILRTRIVQRPIVDPFFGIGLSPAQLNLFLEPVPIVPDGHQIDAASTTYDADAADAEYTCTICQDSFQVGEHILRLNYCSHIFHTVCIHQWFTSSVRCPLCRHDIRELPELELELEVEPESEPETESIS
jgi:hypothetical protein